MSVKNATSGLFAELNRLGVQGMRFLTTGDVYFVDSGATETSDTADGVHGLSWTHPFATIDFAISQCTASQGDIIYVAPNHAETVGAAGGITLDIAGISVIGMGEGDERALITVGAAADANCDVLVSAANIVVENLRFAITAVDVTNMIDVNADGFTLRGCELLMQTATGPFEAVTGVEINGRPNGTNNTTIESCKFFATLAAGSNQAIELGEAEDRVVIVGCECWGDYANACIHNPTGKTLTDLTIKNCILENDNAGDTYCIELVSACTGIITHNLYKSAITQATAADSGSCFNFENYHDDLIDKSGIVCPAVT